MRIIVIGRGGVAFFLTRTLLGKGHSICFVSQDADECAAISRTLGATVVHGDATRKPVLEDAGIRVSDALMALTAHDEVNLAICQIALFHFHTDRVFAMVNDPDNDELFHLLGIKETFSVTPVVSRLIEQRASFDAVLSLFPVAEGRIEVGEIRMEAGAPGLGIAFRDMHLPPDTLIASISRGKDVLVPNGSATLEAGDRLLLVSSRECFDRAVTALVGRS